MQTAPVLPNTAPFAEEQIAALNRVISVTTAEQRAWLSGYLAGLQAANDPQAAAPAAPPAKRAPLTILFGTESGNAEALASPGPQSGSQAGIRAEGRGHGRLYAGQAAAAENLLIVASHLGRGRPAATGAVDFYEALMADDAPRSKKPASPCWHWVTAPMRGSARSAAGSMSVWRPWGAPASPTGSSAIWIIETPPPAGSIRRWSG